MRTTQPFLLFSTLILVIFICVFVKRKQILQTEIIRSVIYNEVQETKDDEWWLKGPPGADDPRILDSMRKRYLVAPSNLPYNMTPEKDNKKYYPHSRSSFHFIDYCIKYLLGNQDKGFFLEAGALDGDIFSNTLWLEREKGWTGVLVEVDPTNFKHLIWKRRKAWLSNTCIARTPYPQQSLFDFVDADPKTHLLWVYRSNSRAVESPFSKDGWARKGKVTRQTVQCFPLASYILALNVTTLDFLSLDIQGFEWEVIKSIPRDKITIRVIAVEYFFFRSTGGGSILDPDFVKYMENIGYYLLEFAGDCNYVFALKNDLMFKPKLDEKKYVKFVDTFKKPK